MVRLPSSPIDQLYCRIICAGRHFLMGLNLLEILQQMEINVAEFRINYFKILDQKTQPIIRLQKDHNEIPLWTMRF